MTCHRCGVKVLGNGHATPDDCITRLRMRQANLGRALKAANCRNQMLRRHLETARINRSLAEAKAKKLAVRFDRLHELLKGEVIFEADN